MEKILIKNKCKGISVGYDVGSRQKLSESRKKNNIEVQRNEKGQFIPKIDID